MMDALYKWINTHLWQEGISRNYLGVVLIHVNKEEKTPELPPLLKPHTSTSSAVVPK